MRTALVAAVITFIVSCVFTTKVSARGIDPQIQINKNVAAIMTGITPKVFRTAEKLAGEGRSEWSATSHGFVSNVVERNGNSYFMLIYWDGKVTSCFSITPPTFDHSRHCKTLVEDWSTIK